MSIIRHICSGHEYRYNTETGIVKNNYGTVKSRLLFCKLTGYAILYAVKSENAPIHCDTTILATIKPAQGLEMSDEQLAQFAIGQTAANFTEH